VPWLQFLTGLQEWPNRGRDMVLICLLCREYCRSGRSPAMRATRALGSSFPTQRWSYLQSSVFWIFRPNEIHSVWGSRSHCGLTKHKKTHALMLKWYFIHTVYHNSVLLVVKSRRTRWAGYVARIGEGRVMYGVLMRKSEGMGLLGRPRRRQ
jgi:hypothetical protein